MTGWRSALDTTTSNSKSRNWVALTPILGEQGLITGDEGPTLSTSVSYDTFIATADIKLIPNKLKLSVRGSYSFANSNSTTRPRPS